MLCVVVCCSPTTWLTSKTTRDGWAQQFTQVSLLLSLVSQALARSSHDHRLTLASRICWALCVIRPFLSAATVEHLWASNVPALLSVLLFHAIVPTSMEPRKIFMPIPSFLLFAAAGVRSVMELLRVSLPTLKLDVSGSSRRPHANMGHVAQRREPKFVNDTGWRKHIGFPSCTTDHNLVAVTAFSLLAQADDSAIHQGTVSIAEMRYGQ